MNKFLFNFKQGSTKTRLSMMLQKSMLVTYCQVGPGNLMSILCQKWEGIHHETTAKRQEGDPTCIQCDDGWREGFFEDPQGEKHPFLFHSSKSKTWRKRKGVRSVNQVRVRTCWSGVSPRYFGIFKNLVKGIQKGENKQVFLQLERRNREHYK